MIYFSDFEASAPVAATGALVYRSTATTTDPTPWDAEAYDVGGWHDTGSNTERLTVPSGVDYVRLSLLHRDASVARLNCLKGGSSFAGSFQAVSDTAGGEAANGTSAIVAVTSGNYFTIAKASASGAEEGSWFSIEAIPSTLKMALVNKSADQAIDSSTTTAMAWGAEIRDTDGFHDNSTNNSRLTVPSGISLVRVSASLADNNAAGASSSSQFVLSFQKNGSSAPGLPQADHSRQTNANHVSAVSAILAVSSGNYFECSAFRTDAVDIDAVDQTWFQIEEVDAATKYALVNKSGSQAISATTFTALAFGAEVADTHSFHDNSTNNSRLTIPAGQGITQARLGFNVTTPSTTGQFIAEVRKNGSSTPVPGLPRQETDTPGGDSVNGFGAWIDVTDGDYFEVFVYSDNGQTLAVVDTTWFCIECR